MKRLVASLNGESQLEFDRTQVLGERQQEYLKIMDSKMEDGIPHGAGHVFAPDVQQKSQFVASQLVDAIKAGNEQLAAATLSWLATRLPGLQQVAAEEKPDGQIAISLIYDKTFVKAQLIKFMKLNS